MKKIVSISIMLIMLLLTACNNEETKSQVDTANEKATEANTQQAELPKPNLENIPEVVAEVNGEKILKEEFETTYKGQFQQAAMQAQMTGQELDQNQLKSQVAEALIGQKLIIQEAENSGYEATEEDINQTIDSIVKQNGLKSQDEFFTTLEKQGMGKEEVYSQIKAQIKVDKLIASEVGKEEPTKEELKELYESYKKQMEQMSGKNNEKTEVPSYEEMESDLIKQAMTNKQSEAYHALIKELKAKADITTNL